MNQITVVLSSANMGDVTEADFDAWQRYVAEEIEEALDLGDGCTTVEQFRFGAAGADHVSGVTEEQTIAIREWLSHAGWDAFCADPSAWPPAAA